MVSAGTLFPPLIKCLDVGRGCVCYVRIIDRQNMSRSNVVVLNAGEGMSRLAPLNPLSVLCPGVGAEVLRARMCQSCRVSAVKPLRR